MAGPDRSQHAQSVLAAALVVQIRKLWPLLDVDNLAESLPTYEAAASAVVRQYGAASATLAAELYEAERAEAGVSGAFTAVPSEPPSPEQVAKAIAWATKSLWSVTPNEATAQARVETATKKAVLDTGRRTTANAAQRDRKALGWMRVTDADPCSWCAMLASRGPVYKSAGSAGRTKNGSFTGPGQFKWHDGDECVAVPIFSFDDPRVAHADELYEQWKSVTARARGKRALAVWRVHWERQHRTS